MTVLVIETATAACSVALLDGRDVLAHRHVVVGRGHAEQLVPMIRDCVGDREAPDTILVDCGPGSFTGVRVGLAAARGLGLVWGARVQGFSSLALLAAMAQSDAVAVAIGGGHGELFVQRFAGDEAVTPIESLHPEAAAAAIPEDLIVGSSASEVVRLRGHGTVCDLLPDASEAWRLPPAFATLPASPLYGRAPDAKVPA
jgi:tRNA threonylcarbamoyladenosine biosynthesis protein TsaB